MKKVLGYLSAGLESGVDNSVKVLGYGAASVMISALINYLSSYQVSSELGALGMLGMTYAVNVVLVFLKKWLFTVEEKTKVLDV